VTPKRVLLGLALGVVASAGICERATADPSRVQASRLFKDGLAHLSEARANGQRFVTVVVVVRPGETEAAAAHVHQVGGTVRHRDDAVGYLRALVTPAGVNSLAHHAAVESIAISITGNNFLPNGERNSIASQAHAIPADSSWLLRHQYRPHEDLGVDALRAVHPSFDGRGVTVALLDGFVDPLLPDFAYAKTLDGRTRAKLVDQVNTTDYSDGEDPYWVHSSQRIHAATDARQTVEGHSIRLPHAGVWQVGWLDERRFDGNAYLRGDLNRDGNPQGASRLFLVAWQLTASEVWVDADQDGDLHDETPLRDYRLGRDVGVLGQDDPATPVRESVGFTITTAPSHDAVSINLGFASHGTEVAGALLASKSADGLVEGIAPGAGLVNFWHGSTTHGLIEGALRAFRDPRVDLVVLQQNVFLTMEYALDDGGSAVARLLDRMIETYGKPAFVPASNIPGPGQLSDVGLGPRAFAVGTYESRTSLWTFGALRVARQDNPGSTGSFGPGGAGQLKPDFVAPLHMVTPNPGFLVGGRSRDLYALRPGRGVCGGSSCATPIAAGVATSLLSGLRQVGAQASVERLRWALLASARPVDFAAHAQGAGLLQAQHAWALLTSHEKPPALLVKGAVDSALSSLLMPPHVGRGTYLRNAESLPANFRVAVRRLDGPSSPVTVGLRWRAADDVFRSVAQIDLPLDTDVSVDVTVNGTAAGFYSAVLAIIDPRAGTVWNLSLHVVVIGEDLTTTSRSTARRSVRLPLQGTQTVPLRIPPGSSGLEVIVNAPRAVRVYLVPPDRKIQPDFQASGTNLRNVVPYPAAGVWLVNVTSAPGIQDRLSACAAVDTEVVVAARLYRLHALPERASTQQVVVQNDGASITAAARSVPMTRRRSRSVVLEPGGSHLEDLVIPEGAEWLSVETTSAGAEDDVDLFVFDCRQARCGLVRAAIGRGSSERVFIAAPKPGKWRVVVGLFAAKGPADVVLALDIGDRQAGRVTTDDQSTRRQPGDRWIVSASAVLPDARPRRVDDAVARLPVVAVDLEARTWVAPAGPQGMEPKQSLAWFPLVWLDFPSAPILP